MGHNTVMQTVAKKGQKQAGLTDAGIDGAGAGLDKGPPEDVVGNAGKPEWLNVAQLP